MEDELRFDMPVHVILRANVIESAEFRIGQARNIVMGRSRRIQFKKGPSLPGYKFQKFGLWKAQIG